MKKNRFLNSVYRPAIGRMTAAERSAGRYLRSPDGHGGGGDGSPGASGGQGGGAPAISLPESLDTVDGLSPQIAALYVKGGDGKFKLDDVASLRSTVGHIKSENQSIKGKLSQFQELQQLGLSIDEIKQMQTERQQREEQRAREEGDWNALKTQMEANFESERSTFKTREQKLTGTINKILVDDAARAALADPEVDGNPVLLLPLIRDRVKVAETDEGFGLQVLRPDGTPMLNQHNQPASLKDLFLEMRGKPEYAGAFKGLNQSGGGAPGGTGGTGGGAPGSKKRSEMSNAEKSEFIRTNGQEAYFRLPA